MVEEPHSIHWFCEEARGNQLGCWPYSGPFVRMAITRIHLQLQESRIHLFRDKWRRARSSTPSSRCSRKGISNLRPTLHRCWVREPLGRFTKANAFHLPWQWRYCWVADEKMDLKRLNKVLTITEDVFVSQRDFKRNMEALISEVNILMYAIAFLFRKIDCRTGSITIPMLHQW